MKLASAEAHDGLYPDRHLNVFVPYRSHGLDYNVMRALISTLRWSRPELTRGFLQEIAGVDDAEGSFHYDLQSCDYEDFDPSQVERQVVLGISVAGRLAVNLPPLDDSERSAQLLGMLRGPWADELKLEEVRKFLVRPELTLDDLACMFHTLEELEDGCLPDGWIFSPEAGVCVLVEAKLTQLLDLSQMQRYADVYFGRDYHAEDMKLASWEKVAAFFAKHREDSDPRTAFLCGQLTDYLDLLALAPFDGFKPYDFDLDTLREALPKFFKFTQAVQAKAAEQGLPVAGTGPSATGGRIQFADPAIPGELRLDLLEDGVRVELRCGSGAKGRSSVDAILAATSDGEQNPLAGQDVPGLHVRLERLRSPNRDGQAFLELETLNDPLQPEEFGYVLEELRRNHPPLEAAQGIAGHYRRGTLSIGRTIPRSAAIAGAGAILDETVAALTVLTKTARLLVPATDE